MTTPERPLADAAERLRGKPGRPRKLRPEVEPVMVPPRLLDVAGAASYLCVSQSIVRNLVTAGLLRRVRIPTRNNGELRKLLFDRADLDRLIETSKEGGR